jgi:outer membrane receptor protein involved in Fe transport
MLAPVQDKETPMRTGSPRVTTVPMSTRRSLPGALALGVLVFVLGTLAGAPARAQAPTTGSVRGVVADQGGEPVAGAIVSIRGPALQRTADVFTEADGSYELDQLPPGAYVLTVTQGNAQISRSNVLVQLGKVVRVNLRLRLDTGEVIEMTGRAPIVDQGSTKTGVTLTESDVTSLPIGRNFDDLLEIAPGAQPDRYGTSFGGSSSPENSYLIEGTNVTDVGFGLATLTLPTEFLREVEIITGGYGAEYGRASGGIVNAVTKSGSNELHGSVFGYYTPGELAGTTRLLPNEASSLVYQRNLAYRGDFGFELGGPLVEDTLWFHVGFSPSLQRQDTDRVITRFFDRDGNGLPDRRDDDSIAYDEVERRTIDVPSRTYFFTSKLSYAASPEHRGSVTVFGNPSNNDLLFDDFAVGPDSALLFAERRGGVAGVARWTSDVLDGSGQLELTLGVQRGRDEQAPALADGALQAVRFQETLPLGSVLGDVPPECLASPNDCPVTNYQLGGIDVFSEEESRRFGGSATYRHIFDALGRHRLQVGADFEENRFDSRVAFSGGTRWWSFPGVGWLGIEFIRPDPDGDIPCGNDGGMCSRGDGRVADARTTNLGAFVQDSWTILPNLSVELGLRYERQGVGAAEQVAGVIDPFSGEPVSGTVFTLNNFSPRAGVIYDWTNEGRSRVFSHWGRYYESIPMGLNVRGFSGEVVDIRLYGYDACTAAFTPPDLNPANLDPAAFGCDRAAGIPAFQQGGSKLVAPGISGQYMDEIVAGVEYEPVPDVKVGAVYIHRALGRAIEDVSPTGAPNLVLANPGEFDADAVADLRARAEDARASGDMDTAARLDRLANTYEGVGDFDRPRRTYDALELSVVKRFSQRWMARASYTYSVLTGNFSGLFSADTTQLDPNINSVYDLPELMFNRNGRLPGDQPHQVKLDAYYQLPVAGVGNFVIGGRVRGASGRPQNYLASHPDYGQGESFLLPRGSGERNPLSTTFDLQLAYGRSLGKDTGLELFVSVFNLFNQQATRRRDELYTLDFVDPIGGGDERDLAHAKNESSQYGQLVTKNPNFDNPTELQLPVTVRFGARLTF